MTYYCIFFLIIYYRNTCSVYCTSNLDRYNWYTHYDWDTALQNIKYFYAVAQMLETTHIHLHLQKLFDSPFKFPTSCSALKYRYFLKGINIYLQKKMHFSAAISILMLLCLSIKGCLHRDSISLLIWRIFRYYCLKSRLH